MQAKCNGCENYQALASISRQLVIAGAIRVAILTSNKVSMWAPLWWVFKLNLFIWSNQDYILIYLSIQYWRLWHIYRYYILIWRINKLLLQHNLYSGANHVPLFHCSCWRHYKTEDYGPFTGVIYSFGGSTCSSHKMFILAQTIFHCYIVRIGAFFIVIRQTQ